MHVELLRRIAEEPVRRAYAPGTFPVFIWMHGDRTEDYLYGLPTAGTPEVKIAT